MRKKAIILLFVFIPCHVFSQSSQFIFTHLREKEGLSNAFINCFLKDRRGFLWIGTYAGLNRYDGSHFYSFKNTKDTSSIPNNVVHALCEDKQGQIWGTTESGIFCYNPLANEFKNYTIPNSKRAVSSFNITRAAFNILCDKKGTIWATGVWTVVKLNAVKDVFEEIEPLSPNSDSLRYYEVRKNGMIEDPSGKGLWLATRRGLHFYDFQTRQYSDYRNSKNSLFTNHSVAALYKSASGHCWFFDNYTKEIIGFEPSSKEILQRIDLRAELPQAFGGGIFEDSEHRLWFSSWSYELVTIDLKNGNTVSRIRHDNADALSVAADFFWAAIEDEDGTVWLGTSNGISKCNTSKSLYRIHHMEEKFPYLKDNSIRMIVEDPVDKSWWMITRDSLLMIHYNPLSGKHVIYDFASTRKNSKGLKPGPVYCMLFINGKPVIATTTGAWQIEIEAHKIVPFSMFKNIDPEFVAYGIAGYNGIYYFANNSGVLKYNSSTGQANLVKYPYKKLKDDQVFGYAKPVISSDGKPWFAMALGWVGYIDEQNNVNPLYIIKDEKKETTGFITSMEPDTEGKIWVACTGVGLYEIDVAKKTSKLWTEADGLMYNQISNAIPDKNGNTWAAGFHKFSVFTHATKRFYNFSLPLTEHNTNYENGLTLLSSGNVLACLKNDIIEFYPHRLNLKPVIKTPHLSLISIAGNEKLLTDEKHLKLESNENSIFIKFGLFTDENIFPYSLEYKLDGFDKDWIQATESKIAVYNNLPPGKYTFRLIAYAKNSSWHSIEKTLSIIIRTPFYKTVWFVLLIGLIIISALAFFYRFRLNKQKQILTLETKAESLEKEKTLVQYESLKQHLNPHFLFNSLTSLRSLIKTDARTATAFLDGMSKVYRYVLKSGEQELVRLQDELDFVKTFTELQKIRFKEGLQINIDIDESLSNKYIAPVTLQNLVENAIKHNTADKDSPLMIAIYIENSYVVVRNNLQRYRIVETSNKRGLTSLITLYRYYSDKPVEINEDEKYFTVKIPLL